MRTRSRNKRIQHTLMSSAALPSTVPCHSLKSRWKNASYCMIFLHCQHYRSSHMRLRTEWSVIIALSIETWDERLTMKDRHMTEDILLVIVDLFDVIKYTSDKRSPLSKDLYYTVMCRWHSGWSLVQEISFYSANESGFSFW